MFYLVTEDGVVTSKLSGSYIPCFSDYVISLSEITQYSEVSVYIGIDNFCVEVFEKNHESHRYDRPLIRKKI